jgi:hypothetical protein
MDAQFQVARNAGIPVMACKKLYLRLESIGRIVKHGPLDECQSFEKRRWLKTTAFGLWDFAPVLGKDERPTLFTTVPSSLGAL